MFLAINIFDRYDIFTIILPASSVQHTDGAQRAMNPRDGTAWMVGTGVVAIIAMAGPFLPDFFSNSEKPTKRRRVNELK